MTETSFSTSSTRVTLLLRVRDKGDGAAWEEFVAVYAPRIYTWCRQSSLQDSDAADVTQQVLYKLVQVMRDFQYDPSRGSFRAWLKTVTGNAVRDLAREWKKPGRTRGDGASERYLLAIESPSAVDALSQQVESAHDEEVLRVAEERVQKRVQPKTWEAYLLTARGGLPPAEVARRVGMPVSEIYVAKSRVLRMLREEVTRLGVEPAT